MLGGMIETCRYTIDPATTHFMFLGRDPPIEKTCEHIRSAEVLEWCGSDKHRKLRWRQLSDSDLPMGVSCVGGFLFATLLSTGIDTGTGTGTGTGSGGGSGGGGRGTTDCDRDLSLILVTASGPVYTCRPFSVAAAPRRWRELSVRDSTGHDRDSKTPAYAACCHGVMRMDKSSTVYAPFQLTTTTGAGGGGGGGKLIKSSNTGPPRVTNESVFVIDQQHCMCSLC